MSFNYHYSPRVIAANTTIRLTNGKIGGFACTVSGTLTIKDGGGNTIVNAIAVTAGQWLPLPFVFTPGDQAVATTAGGAAGTLAA